MAKKKQTNSRAKGARGELEAAHMLEKWYPSARRSQQYNGKGKGDVVLDEIPHLHIEVKFGYPATTFGIGLALWWSAVEQSERDSDGDPWILLWRLKRSSRWCCTYLGVPGLCTVVEDSNNPECTRIKDVIEWISRKE